MRIYLEAETTEGPNFSIPLDISKRENEVLNEIKQAAERWINHHCNNRKERFGRLKIEIGPYDVGEKK